MQKRYNDNSLQNIDRKYKHQQGGKCTDGVIMYEHHWARVIMHGPTTWASLASEGVVRLGLREIPPLVSGSGFSSWPLGIQNDSQYYKVYVVN